MHRILLLSFCVLSCSRSVAEIDDMATYTAQLIYGANPKPSLRMSLFKNKVRLVRVESDGSIKGGCEAYVWQDTPELVTFHELASVEPKFAKVPAPILGEDLRAQGIALIQLTKNDKELRLGSNHPLKSLHASITSLIELQKTDANCSALFIDAKIP
jgi:hypothetical protein